MSSARVGHQIGQDRSSKRVRKGSPAVHRATNYQSSFKLKYGKYFTDRRYKKLPHQPEVLQREDSYYQSCRVWLHDCWLHPALSWSAGKLVVAGWMVMVMVKVNAPLRPGFLHNCCWRNYAGQRQRAESSRGEQIWIVSAGGELPAQCQPSPHRGILTVMRNMQYIALLYACTFWPLFSDFAPHPIKLLLKINWKCSHFLL